MNLRAGRSALGIALGITVGIAAAVLVLGVGSDTMQPRTPVDVASLGPQVGERVPGFSLPDQNGQVWTHESVLGPKGAILLFHRSADW
jgi:hypothetical protein